VEQHHRACGFLDGEAGDDVTEDHIGKDADAVEVDGVGTVKVGADAAIGGGGVGHGSGLVDDVEWHD
jgi:hypothetical protein